LNHLHQIIAVRTQEWRNAGYSCHDFPAIAEILEYQIEPETRTLRFLRKPQLRALETYWYTMAYILNHPWRNFPKIALLPKFWCN
jgi:hypothetical protein